MITGYTLHSIMIFYIILYVIGILLFLAFKCPFNKIFKSRRIKESYLKEVMRKNKNPANELRDKSGPDDIQMSEKAN